MSDKSKLPEIVITTDRAIGTILIDGVDMSDKIIGYEIKHKGGNYPELVLHLSTGYEEWLSRSFARKNF